MITSCRSVRHTPAVLAEGRDNNFNLIRFAAALLVLFTHSFALTRGTGDAEPLRSSIGMSWGDIAVDVFFVTSGFLIAKSWTARRDAAAFVWARIIRIWPALVASVLFCALIIGPVFTTLMLPDYFTHPTTFRFVAKNILLFRGLEPNLPGVFTDTPYPGTINGSLWTLPHEIRMYAILSLVLLTLEYAHKRIRRMPAPKFAMLAAAVLFTSRNLEVYFSTGARPSPETNLIAMFFAGAACYFWRDKIILHRSAFALACLALAITGFGNLVFFAIYSLALPYLILFLACVPAGAVRGFNRLGDYSYGIYIYAFPIQQTVLHCFPGSSVPFVFMSSLVPTLALSCLSWHLLEKKCLKLKIR